MKNSRLIADIDANRGYSGIPTFLRSNICKNLKLFTIKTVIALITELECLYQMFQNILANIQKTVKFN